MLWYSLSSFFVDFMEGTSFVSAASSAAAAAGSSWEFGELLGGLGLDESSMQSMGRMWLIVGELFKQQNH